MIRISITALIVLAASPAVADDPLVKAEASAHLERGLAEYEARNFEAATLEFQAAYTVEPRREILFVWAQAERLSGDCTTASILYRKFLALAPPEEEAAKARARLADCEASRVAAQPPPPISPPPAPAPLADPRPWYADRLAGSLVAAGVLTFGVAGYLVIDGRAAIEAAGYQEFDRRAAAADRRYWLGVGGLALAGGLLTTGALRYALADREAERVSLRLAPGSATLAVAGRF